MDSCALNPMHAPRFSGIATFMRAPLILDPSKLDIAMIGVPYDGAVENRTGQRHGPRQIRDMSSMMRTIHHVTRINPYEICRIGDMGDVMFTNPYRVEESHQDIFKFIESVVKAFTIPLCVGGDHSITLPILRALGGTKPVGMVHIDAHTDTCDMELNNKYTHGTPFRRAVEEGVLDPKRTVQIGIRGAQNFTEGWDFSETCGMRVIYIEEFVKMGIDRVVEEVRRVVGRGPVYITFDIDSLDPAFAPGTGTPEVGGILPIQAQELIRGLSGLDLVGADIVEVSPPLDPSGNTALVAATIMFELLCILASTLWPK